MNRADQNLRLTIQRQVHLAGQWTPATGANMLAALREAMERVPIPDDLTGFDVDNRSG